MVKQGEKGMDKKVDILGTRVSGAGKQEVLDYLGKVLVSGSKKGLVRVVTLNPEQVVQASDDDAFRHILNESEIAIADGVGLAWAARVLGREKLTRITGRELAEEMINVCKRNEQKVMIVGGVKGVAVTAARQLQNLKSQISSSKQITNSKLKAPNGFEVKGLEGAKDIRNETENEHERVLGEVKKVKPALLLVAYGAPWQEKWIAANEKELAGMGVKVAMVVGGAVDVWAGKVKLAPQVVRLIGFEWLWRLVHEPWRWKRQLRLIRFVGLVLLEMMGMK